MDAKVIFDHFEPGFVVLSFEIDSLGGISTIESVEYHNEILLKECIPALSKSSGKWEPASYRDRSLNFTYLIPFRFDAFTDQQPPDWERKVKRLIKKGKFDKAIQACDQALDSDPYQYKFYLWKSEAKMQIGNEVGAREEQRLYDLMG